MTTLIPIANYVVRFTSYPVDLIEFCLKNKVDLRGIDSKMGQAYALMAQPEVRGKLHLGRKETEQFFTQIGMDPGDAIQAFNKNIGLKRIKGRGIYCLAYPFEADLTDVEKRRGAGISGDRNTLIDSVKDWWRKNLVDVPNDEWQVGHLDPTIAEGAAETNLAFQPPIQGKYRNRFKWDSLFQKMWPTGEEWIAKMDDYHTEAEQKRMLAALKAKWET